MTTNDVANLPGNVRAFIAYAEALLETVEAMPEGAPAGPLYATVMGLFSYDQFERLMHLLVQAGRVRKVGHVYHPVSKA